MNDKLVEELEFTIKAYRASSNKKDFYIRLKTLFLEGVVSKDVFNVFRKIFEEEEKVAELKKRARIRRRNVWGNVGSCGTLDQSGGGCFSSGRTTC